MTAEKPKPTEFTILVRNPNPTYAVPLPTGVAELGPEQSTQITVTAAKLPMYASCRHLVVEIVGDNSDQLATAAKDRASRTAEARERLAALKTTFEERRQDEQELEARLAAVEAEERESEGRDRAALLEAGRSPQETATSVLLEAGAKADEITALTFDLWGAQLRRLEAEAVYNDTLAVVAAADARAHQEKIQTAGEKVSEAQAELSRVKSEREGVEDLESRANRDAAEARDQLARLEASGPESIAL